MPAETRPVALVTGSSSGIGAECARRLAADGYAVVVNSRSSVAAGEAVAAEVGGTYLQADVGDEAAAKGLIDAIVDRFGRLDVLVNNAGTTEVISHNDLGAATADEITDTLLQGRAVARSLHDFLHSARGKRTIDDLAAVGVDLTAEAASPVEESEWTGKTVVGLHRAA